MSLTATVETIELEQQQQQQQPPSTRLQDNNHATSPQEPQLSLSKTRSSLIITQLCLVNLLAAFSTGLLTICLPTIATSLSLPSNLLLWPSSVWALTCGSTLLLSGSFASVLGPKPVHIAGSLTLALTILACGFARNAGGLIAARALQGIASAMVLPSGLGIVSERVAVGKLRNMGFACIGFANMLGFSLGLVLGGVVVQTVGWRAGYWGGGAVGVVLTGTDVWVLPSGVDDEGADGERWWRRLRREVDWVGAGLACGTLAILSYVLATLSASTSHIRSPTTIALLTLSLLLALCFILWMHRQQTHQKPALIPNTLWTQSTFTSIAVVLMLTTATINSLELTSSLYFQKIQHRSALTTSLYILPSLIIGSLLNLTTGLYIQHIRPIYAATVSTGLTALAPLLMALLRPGWSYWTAAFWAQILQPLSRGVVFTVGILIVSELFPKKEQALAGAVFNTVAQLGTSIGLTVTAVVTNAAAGGGGKGEEEEGALAKGYRASFWMMGGWMVVACIVGGAGLRKTGKVGVKRE